MISNFIVFAATPTTTDFNDTAANKQTQRFNLIILY